MARKVIRRAYRRAPEAVIFGFIAAALLLAAIIHAWHPVAFHIYTH